MIHRIAMLVLATMLAAPLAAHAVAGRIQFVSGDVRLVLKDGATRPAQKGDPVNEGDTVITGAYSAAQLKMIDEGLIAVRPDTVLRVDTYVFSGREDGNERGVLGLLKGGFRTLTGVIGRSNRANYLVRTPNATIGIRGTDHEPLFIPPPSPGEAAIGTPGTYNKVNVGETFIEAGGIRIELGANEAGFASLQPGVPPVRLDRVPGFMRATPLQQSRDDRRGMRESSGGDQRRIAAGQQQGAGQGPGQPGRLGQGRPIGPPPLPGGGIQPVFNQQATGQIGFQQFGANLTPAPADFYGVGADLAASGATGSGSVTVGSNGSSIQFGQDGFPVIISSGDGFQYARAGAPLVDAGFATFNDGGTPVTVRWGVYAGGAVVDSQGPRATQFFQFMGAQGTPAAVVATLNATYGGVGNLVASTKLVTEGGVVGGTVLGLNTSISISGGNLTQYQVRMIDGLARSWQACAFSCSVGNVSLSTFAKSGVQLTGIVGPGSGITGRAQGAPVGPTGAAMVSSFDLKTTDGKTVTGAFTVK